MRWLIGLACIIAGLVIGMLFISSGSVRFEGNVPIAIDAPNIDVSTIFIFVSILLTAVTAVLAAVTIGLGVLAVFTFREIRTAAEKTAKSTAEETAKLTAEEVAIKVANDRAKEILEKTDQAMKPFNEELDRRFDPNDDGER